MKKIFFCILLSLLAIDANAQFRDGNRLLSELESSSSVERTNALNYIIGAFDTINEVDMALNKDTKNFMFCQPQNMTAGQLSDMVKNYLKNNPQIRHMPGPEIVWQVLRIAFPCKRQENTQPPLIRQSNNLF